jgi:hypothetical protein
MRSDAAPFVADPSLGHAEIAYALAARITLDVGLQPSADVLVREMIARIRARVSAIRTARAAYDAAVSTHVARARAAERVGDLWDAIGAEIGSVPIAMPADLAQQISRASPDVQLDIHQQLTDRLHAAMQVQAFPVFCEALTSYRDAAAQGVDAPRASTQIAAYGESFAAACDAPHAQP